MNKTHGQNDGKMTWTLWKKNEKETKHMKTHDIPPFLTLFVSFRSSFVLMNR